MRLFSRSSNCCQIDAVAVYTPFHPILYYTVAEVGKVSVLYGGNALLGEGPFYDQAREELVWVDFTNKLINFLDVNTRSNRSLQLEGRPASAAIPCQDDDSKLVAMIGRTICLVDRGSGKSYMPFSCDEPERVQ